MKLAIGCLIALGALMALCAITTGIGTAFAYFSQPATNTTTRTFHVSGAPTIQLDVSAASVNVNSGASDAQVSVTLASSMHYFSHQAAENAIQSIKFTTTQDDNTIVIHESEEHGFQIEPFNTSSITLDITVPAHTNISGDVQAGSMTVDGLTGSMNVTNDAGSMTLQQMTFTGSSILQLSAGSLTFDGALAQGAQVNATVNAGSVTCTLPKSSGAHLDANTSAGSISVEGWDLPVTQDAAVASATGDVGAHPVGSLTIQADAGSVTVILD